METDPQSIFEHLSNYAKNNTNGPYETLQVLNTLNRNLIEEQQNSSYIDLYLLHIFEKSYGLINFVNETMRNKNFKNSPIKALEILYTLVNNFPTKLTESNIRDIFDLCIRVLKSDAVSLLKVRILELLKVSLEKLNLCIENEDVSSVCKQILISLQNALKQNHADTVKHQELFALGLFTKRYQYLIHNPTELQQLFIRNLESEMIKPKKSQNVICGFFKGYSCFCESYPLSIDNTNDKKLIDKLYKFVKILVTPTDRMKFGNKAAMEFLSAHVYIFGDFLLKDYKFWHDKLLIWLEMGADEKKVGEKALRALFQAVSTVLNQKNEGDFCSVVEHFNNWCQNVLKKENAPNNEKHLAIYCLRLFAGASFKYSPRSDLMDLFMSIMQHFEQTYILNYDPTNEQWEYLPDYIQTVANFMQYRNFTVNEFFCLQRAVINMIKSFPQLPYLHYELVIDGIVMTCFYLKEGQYFDLFLENMVYQGVVWSCSHHHISNAEFSEETVEKIITVKSFFPLWKGLLGISSNRTYDKYNLYLEDRKYILERIVNQLIKTLMILINKLNISVSLNDEDISVTDPKQAYQVEQTNDFAIFLNLIDFYQEIFDKIEAIMFKKSICKIIKHLINKCVQFPLISGFYKLLSYSLKISNKLHLFNLEENDQNSRIQDIQNIRETLLKFLELLLEKMVQYKDELLISCLQVLLETSPDIIHEMLFVCITPFTTIFNVGRSYLPLAEMGLNTLEYWQDNINSDDFDPFLAKIVPSLDTYLRSKSLGGQTHTNVMEKKRKTEQTLKKRKILLELEPELIKFQKRILSFIGKQNSKICQSFIHSDNVIVPSIICGENLHLKITLPYEDVRLDIYLDTFVPRIINLALYCSDRKIRITACELFQAVIMVFLGRAKAMSQSGLSELDDLLKTIAMPLFQLGCDIDQLVQQIFKPLCMQLIHWYTSPTQIGRSHSAIIIDVMMEGITHPTDSCLRDFSGKCINEFVKWTIKQANESTLSKDPINIKVLVKKMRYFGSHPDFAKKLGAALIFNNIYRELREEDSLISIFWIEILHILVNSLSSIENTFLEENTTVVQIKNAIQHLQRVFVGKAVIFRTGDNHRRIPSGFQTCLLKDVALWLLEQTGSRSEYCRESCMNLFIAITPLSSEKPINLQEFIKDNGLQDLISNIYEKSVTKNPTLADIKNTEDCTILLKWMQDFICAVDGLNFVIKNNLGDINFDTSVTFKTINYFLKNIQEVSIADALNLIHRKSWNFTYLDREQFTRQKSTCVFSILKLFNSVVSNEVLCRNSNSIWTIEFWKLILSAIFYPDILGINNKVSQLNHFSILTILLNNIPRKIPKDKTFQLAEILHNYIEEKSFTSIDLKKNVILEQRNIIKGLLLLQSTGINKELKVEKYTSGLVNELVQNFYNIKDDNTIYVNELQETTIEYCTLILEFSLNNQNEFKYLVNHLHQPYLVQCMEFSKEIKFGVYLLNIFGEVIIPHILSNFENFLKLSVDSGNLEITLDLVMFILNYIIKNRSFKNNYNNVSKMLLNHWNIFKDYFISSVEKIHLSIEYLKLLIPITNTRLVEYNMWLLQHLLDEDDLSNNIQLLALLVQITDDTSVDEMRDGMETALSNLSKKILTDENRANFFLNKILTLIPNLKSTTILTWIVELYLKLNTTFEIVPYLVEFIKNIDKNLQSATLKNIYRMYYNENETFGSNYKMVKYVIPPLLQNCNIRCCEAFYEQNILSIITALQDKTKLRQNILYFELIEILFLRIPIGSPERTDCSISKAAECPNLMRVLLKVSLEAFKNCTMPSEELRLYKCHAYNALSSIISNSDETNNSAFYDKLFIRQENNKDILWNGIINTTEIYDFPIVFDSLPSQRTVLTNIRNEIKAQQRKNYSKSNSMKYIESQKLFNSSLSEDVTNFDFSNVSLRNAQLSTEKLDETLDTQSTIKLDDVSVNDHECMATICALIQHMYDTGVNQLPEGEEVELPNWMKGLRKTLLDQETHKNVKIYLVKVIQNMIHIFNHYSKWFLEPFLQFILDKCVGDTINYFVTDTLVILAQWAGITRNLDEKECLLVSEVLKFLISNLNNDRRDILKYNTELIKLMVESWKEYICVPTEKLFELISSENKCEIGINLTSIFLVNRMTPWKENNMNGFINTLIKRLDFPKKLIYRSCSETFGLLLHYLNDQPAQTNYVDQINTYLKKISNLEKYVYCLEGVTIHFPHIVNSYHISKLISSLNQVPDNQKILHLKIIYKRAELSLDILEEVSDFQIVEWDHLLENSNLEIQIITLEIVKKCLTVFVNYKCFINIVNTLSRNMSNPNVLYRSGVYDIAILIYQQNKDNLDICKEILILGLLDIDDGNREKIIKFWTENSNMPTNLIDRFPYLFSNLYKTKIEDQFLGYTIYILLDILNKIEDYSSPIFEHPLEDCNFEDYQLQTNWRLQHPSVVPLFAETLQSSFDVTEPYSEVNLFQLKKTQTTFAFTPTQSVHDQNFSKFTSLESSLSVNISDSNNLIKNPNELDLSQKYRIPKRFLKDKSKISMSYANYETTKRIKKVQQRLESVKEREKRVTIYRKYRKGDFPDIQITLSSILEPLQMLTLRDSEVSKIFFSEIFNGIIVKVEDNKYFIETVYDSIKNIFNNSTYYNPNLFSTLLDILIKNKNKMRFDSQMISYVCQQSGLLSIGTLLLEEYLISIDDQPSTSKKGSGSQENIETAYWVKLAELYKELEEWEMVRSIFLQKMNCKDTVHKAVQYELEAHWRNAQDLYEELIKTDMSAERRDFYYESYFKCFANLGEWQYIPETIDSIVTSTTTDNTWDILWDNGWYQQKLLPWYISSQVKNTLFSQTWPDEFSRNLNKSLNNAAKADYLQINFSEELCMMWLFKKDIATASLYLQNYIRNFLSEWQLLNPTFQSLRYRKLLELRNIMEISEFITSYNHLSENPEIFVKKLTSRWENTSSEMLPSILLNETRVLYRAQFINLLTDKIANYHHTDWNDLVKDLKLTKLKMETDLINIAVELNNYWVSRKYFKKYTDKQNITLLLACGNIALLKSKMLTDPEKEVETCLQAINIYDSIFKATQDSTIILTTNRKYFEALLRVSKILTSDTQLFIHYQQKLREVVKKGVDTPEEIGFYAAETLRSFVENVKDDSMECENHKSNTVCNDIAKAYVQLAHFTRDQNNENLQGQFILYVLRAMKLNSLEAKQLFPCILMLNKLEEEHKRLFIIETEKIPTWMFLGWIPQLLANIDSRKVMAISKIILRIAETYPQAIMYPYRLSKENFKCNDRDVEEESKYLVNSLDKLLLNDDMVDKFLRALSNVSIPAAILKYYVGKMYKAKDEAIFKAIQTNIMNNLFGETPGSGSVYNLQGNMFKSIGKYKREFSKIMSIKNAKTKDILIKIDGELKLIIGDEKAQSLLLKDYCPWLNNFSANKLNFELEIPGQYNGDKLPLIQHHIKIAGFCPNVSVMKSIRKPIKITILGMDTKEYPFLIKFGEDIRQDQRIEQLFGLMNNIFKNDTNCTYSGLNILTYQVIPLTTSLGIIQWINETQPLKHFLEKSIKDKTIEHDFENKIGFDYRKWLHRGKSDRDIYGMSAVKYSKDKTLANYQSMVNRIPWDIMRTSFQSLSTCTENYIALRNNFIKTYSVLCTCHWILGIGDRHLDNSLICLRNGKVLGIDFGHAFGTATQILPVPELVPFRLTPHIVNFMLPLKERGLFRECMIHSLRALRTNCYSLLATMNVFIEEPSLDWLEHASSFESESTSEVQNWYPTTKVDQAKRKLIGENSPTILIEDLQASRNIPQFTNAYVKLVMEITESNQQFAENSLTVENQVDCLIEHATSYNLLGRMYAGWMPWV